MIDRRPRSVGIGLQIGIARFADHRTDNKVAFQPDLTGRSLHGTQLPERHFESGPSLNNLLFRGTTVAVVIGIGKPEGRLAYAAGRIFRDVERHGIGFQHDVRDPIGTAARINDLAFHLVEECLHVRTPRIGDPLGEGFHVERILREPHITGLCSLCNRDTRRIDPVVHIVVHRQYELRRTFFARFVRRRRKQHGIFGNGYIRNPPRRFSLVTIDDLRGNTLQSQVHIGIESHGHPGFPVGQKQLLLHERKLRFADITVLDHRYHLAVRPGGQHDIRFPDNARIEFESKDELPVAAARSLADLRPANIPVEGSSPIIRGINQHVCLATGRIEPLRLLHDGERQFQFVILFAGCGQREQDSHERHQELT